MITNEQSPSLGEIAIVGSDRETRIEFSNFPLTRSQAAAGGALEGAVRSLECGPAYFLCAIFFVPFGAILEGVNAESAPGVEAIEQGKQVSASALTQGSTLLVTRLNEIALNFKGHKLSAPRLNEESYAEKDKLKSILANGYQSILVVHIDEIESKTNENRVRFILTASAVLTDANSGELINTQSYRVSTRSLDLSNGMLENQNFIREEYDFAVSEIANRIMESFFLTEYIVDEQTETYDFMGIVTRGAQFEPHIEKPKGSLCGPFIKIPCREFDKLKILNQKTPAFYWKPFPEYFTYGRPFGSGGYAYRKNRKTMDADDLLTFDRHFDSISQVNYDFQILSLSSEFRYERKALESNQHKMVKSLEPCQAYRWSVRARYFNAGREFTTGWSYPQLFRTGC